MDQHRESAADLMVMPLDQVASLPRCQCCEPTLPCPTCDGTGQTMMRGDSHRDYDDPDYVDRCGICGGSGELPASMFVDADEDEPVSLADHLAAGIDAILGS